MVTMLIISTLVAGIPNAAAATGNETVSLSSVTNSSASVDLTNLDSNETYYWWAFIYYPSGLLHGFDYGTFNGVSGNASYNASWTIPTTNGTYSINCELTDLLGLSLSNTTSQFVIGGGLTGNEAVTASNITHVGALVTGTNLSSSEVYQWSVFTYFPSGSLHNSDSGIWNSPSSSTMTTSQCATFPPMLMPWNCSRVFPR